MVKLVKACILLLLCGITFADVGVPETGEVRLVSGSGSYEGRVEVFYDSQWGTVCDDLWDIDDASVVCRQLGFANTTNAFRWAFFGGGTPKQPIFMDGLQCSGHETELTECEHNGWEIHNCVHSEDAGVRCHTEYTEGDVRLAGGPTSRDGRLEIYHNNEWGTVCSTTWGPEEAEVTCRQLGNDGVNNVYYSPTPGNGPIHLSHVGCIGNETGLVDCNVTYGDDGNSSCTHSKDVGVDCYTLLRDPTALQGEIRLTDSTTVPRNGRLEIYHGNSWGTVCGDGWHQTDSQVACRQLGFLDAYDATEIDAPRGFIGPVHLSDVNCTGDEVALSHCPHGGLGENECRHARDIWLSCLRDYYAHDGDVRIVDGEKPWAGRLQIFHDQQWGTVCNDSWSYENALVVCRQLGFEGVVSSYEYYGPGYGPIQLGGVACAGNENTLMDCSRSEWGVSGCTSHEQDVGIKCTEWVEGELRLVGGHDYGRLEIFHNDEWGTICNDGWSTNEALVACRQLGFPGVAIASSYYGIGDGPIHLDDVSCTGYESQLINCSNNGWGIHNCQHYDDVGIQCLQIPEPVDPMTGELIAIIVIASVAALCFIIGIIMCLCSMKKKPQRTTTAQQIHDSRQTMPTGHTNPVALPQNGVMYYDPNNTQVNYEDSPPSYPDVMAGLPTSK
ncbi:scavenger receptor cysteine-rich domain superfamily protein-like [Diadema antillarum]|uniref:scavenger receptor cysteine-rich domain superfamily protein-like n=1 Tax=Diadema antillarum TaxID=105358 RepID=UPI003A84CE85